MFNSLKNYGSDVNRPFKEDLALAIVEDLIRFEDDPAIVRFSRVFVVFISFSGFVRRLVSISQSGLSRGWSSGWSDRSLVGLN